jgi:molybdenum cofactor cytidylyltransferase
VDEPVSRTKPVGILLAAGRGRRFDASGQHDKLLALLPCGNPVAVVAAQKLRAPTGRVIAVVRPDNPRLFAVLDKAGCEVIVCANADEGMGAVLAYAVRHCAEAPAWLVALADMPFIEASSYLAVIAGLADNDLVAPEFSARRGHPVAFSRHHLENLLNLSGDVGARQLFALGAPLLVRVTDEGVIRDIDTTDDL